MDLARAGVLDVIDSAGPAQVHLALWGPLPGAVRGLSVPALQERAGQEQLVHSPFHDRVGQISFRDGQRQFGGGADQMSAQDDRIGRIEHGRFGRALEEVAGVAHEVLVQGVFLGNEDHGAVLAAASHPAAALPGGHDRAGIAHQQAQIQVADVDAQLQGVGGDDGQQLPEWSRASISRRPRAESRAVGADAAWQGPAFSATHRAISSVMRRDWQ